MGAIVSGDVTGLSVTCVTQSFLVGGMFTGLGGSVSLRLDPAGETGTWSGNMPFFLFTSMVTSGSPWAVSIVAQPATQLCTVTNGSGIMGNGDVRNVSVSCLNRWPITVQFNNLQSPVTVTLNATSPTVTEVRTVTPANPVTTFASLLLTGQAFSVDFVDPASPAQTCTPRPLTGLAGPTNAVFSTCSP
jgi:hypothetical protein